MLWKSNLLLFNFLILCNFSFAQNFDLFNNKKKISFDFKHVGGLVIIPVSINGSPLMNFVLDTGSAYTVITNLDAINHFDLKKGKSITISGLGKDKTELEAYLSYENSIEIAQAHSSSVNIVLLYEKGFDLGTRFGLPIFGIIGYDLLKDFVVEINYIKDRITLYKPDHFYAKKNLSKFHEVPLMIRQNKPYITLETEIDQKKIPLQLLIDTGSWESLWLFEKPHENIDVPENYVEDYLGYGLNGEIHGKRSRMEKLWIGPYEIKNLTTSYPDSLSVSQVSRNDRNGTIGSEILQRFTTIYDLGNRKLFLRKNSKFNEAFHYNLAGLELYQPFPELPYLEVSYVRENSPAFEAGIRKGYAIKSINKKKISIFNNHPHSPSNQVSKMDEFHRRTNQNETISLPEIIQLFKTKEGQLIEVVYTKEESIVEHRTEFRLKKAI